MTDRAFCFSLVLAILMVSDVEISPDDSEGVVLAKVMEVAKEIRPDDKKRGAAPAGCRAALWSAGGCWSAGGGGWLEAYAAGWRMLAFLGAGEARREGRRRGWWCCRWLPGLRG